MPKPRNIPDVRMCDDTKDSEYCTLVTHSLYSPNFPSIKGKILKKTLLTGMFALHVNCRNCSNLNAILKLDIYSL